MRKWWGIALAASMLLYIAVPVHAEDYTGGSGWKVQFTGNAMTSNFTSADIAAAVHALPPGDSVTISLSLENSSNGDTQWYMTNKVLSSLEDSSEAARGGAYTYELSYTDEGGAVPACGRRGNRRRNRPARGHGQSGGIFPAGFPERGREGSRDADCGAGRGDSGKRIPEYIGGSADELCGGYADLDCG